MQSDWEGFLMNNGARTLNPNDIEDFDQLAYQRENPPKQSKKSPKQPVSSVNKFMAEMHKYNKVRLWRLKRDMNWFIKQAAKHGIDADQARFLL